MPEYTYKEMIQIGVNLEVGKFRQYTVRMDGSSRISIRNRRHVQKIIKNVPEVTHVLHKNNTSMLTTPFIPPKETVSPDTANTSKAKTGTNTELHTNLPPNLNTRMDEVSSSSSSSSTESNLRRSKRTIKKPIRYHDEFEI